jgi:antitoxin VapB
MALNIKDPETERLVAEVAKRTGKSKTAAVREVMRNRLEQLEVEEAKQRDGESDFTRFLREEIWPQISPEHLGKPVTRAEEDEILGYGPGGV